MGTIGRTSSRHRGHGLGAIRRIAMSRRSDGSVGCDEDVARPSFFFCCHALVLQEGKSNHREYGMMVQSKPGTPFKVV